MEHVKSVLEASVDYHYPNHPEPEAEPGDMGEVSDGYHTFNELYRYRMLYNAAFFNLLARNGQVEVCKSRRQLLNKIYKQQHRIFSEAVLSRRTRQGKQW